MSESRRLPLVVFLVAMVMAVLHMVPTWIAMGQVPSSEWVFTGNLRGSPDFMQYFAWARRTEFTGPLVDNTFTSEPNSPHLLMLPYYLVGSLARWLDISPELTSQYLGSVYAFAFVVLLFVVSRTFFESRHQTWWVFWALLWGGGLSGYLKFLPLFEFAYMSIIDRTLTYGERVGEWFEDFRGFLIFKTFFDSHFLLIWVLMTGTALVLYHTLSRFSIGRLIATCAMFAVLTMVHLYEGVTLSAIGVSALLFCWLKGLLRPSMVLTVAMASATAAACILWQVVLFTSGGLPLPDWREPDILVSALVFAFTWAWILMAWRFGDYWSRAGLRECFLVGWMVACLAMIFSGPFYPYPTRGAHSLQIPVTLIGGAIFFHRWRRMTLRLALVAILLLSGSSIWELRGEFRRPYMTERPYAFLDPGRRSIVEDLEQAGTRQDLLLARDNDLRWIAPRYPGRHYCGHFFLTVDYEAKCEELDRFFERPVEEQEFLRRVGARFLYVDRAEEPSRFATVPGLVVRDDVPAGVLFEFTGS